MPAPDKINTLAISLQVPLKIYLMVHLGQKFRRGLVITWDVVSRNATFKMVLPLEGKAIDLDSDLRR